MLWRSRGGESSSSQGFKDFKPEVHHILTIVRCHLEIVRIFMSLAECLSIETLKVVHVKPSPSSVTGD